MKFLAIILIVVGSFISTTTPATDDIWVRDDNTVSFTTTESSYSVVVHVYCYDGVVRLWGTHSDIPNVKYLELTFPSSRNGLTVTPLTTNFDHIIGRMMRDSEMHIVFHSDNQHSGIIHISLLDFAANTQELRSYCK